MQWHFKSKQSCDQIRDMPFDWFWFQLKRTFSTLGRFLHETLPTNIGCWNYFSLGGGMGQDFLPKSLSHLRKILSKFLEILPEFGGYPKMGGGGTPFPLLICPCPLITHVGSKCNMTHFYGALPWKGLSVWVNEDIISNRFYFNHCTSCNSAWNLVY